MNVNRPDTDTRRSTATTFLVLVWRIDCGQSRWPVPVGVSVCECVCARARSVPRECSNDYAFVSASRKTHRSGICNMCSSTLRAAIVSDAINCNVHIHTHKHRTSRPSDRRVITACKSVATAAERAREHRNV